MAIARPRFFDDDSDDQVHSSSHEHDVATLLFQAADLHDDHEMGFLEFATLAVTAAAAHEGGATAQVDLIWLLLLEVKHHEGRGGANITASTLEVGDDCVHQEDVARLVRHCLALGVLDLDGGGGKSGGGKGGGHARAERVTAALFHDCDLGDGAEVSHELFHKKLGPFFRAAGARVSGDAVLPAPLATPARDFHDLLAAHRKHGFESSSNRGGGGGCFTPGTLVAMGPQTRVSYGDGRGHGTLPTPAALPLKPIEALELGDETAGGARDCHPQVPAERGRAPVRPSRRRRDGGPRRFGRSRRRRTSDDRVERRRKQRHRWGSSRVAEHYYQACQAFRARA